MIRIHYYNSQEAVLDGIIGQLIKHVKNTRFFRISDLEEAHYNDKCTDSTEVMDFKLALSGGEIINRLFDHLRNNYIENTLLQKISYYWLNERYLPYHHPESHFGNAYRRFFQHIPINSNKLYPIPIANSSRESTTEYCKSLRRTLCIQYDPMAGQCCDILRPELSYSYTTQFSSPFHGAIIDAGNFLKLSSPPPVIGRRADYYTSCTPFTLQRHITASRAVLNSIPRIIIPIIGNDNNPQYAPKEIANIIKLNLLPSPSHKDEDKPCHHHNINIYTNIRNIHGLIVAAKVKL